MKDKIIKKKNYLNYAFDADIRIDSWDDDTIICNTADTLIMFKGNEKECYAYLCGMESAYEHAEERIIRRDAKMFAKAFGRVM